MPIYDKRCPRCGFTQIDVMEPVSTKEVPCGALLKCDGFMERVWLPGSAPGVIPDDIPGGLEIKHGLCNPDGSPKKYYSKSEIAREAKERGMENYVEHRGTKGGDKSPHTNRWV